MKTILLVDDDQQARTMFGVVNWGDGTPVYYLIMFTLYLTCAYMVQFFDELRSQKISKG